MRPILLFLLLFLISTGCEYPLNEIYNRKVKQDVTAPNIQVVELNLDADTLYVYENFNIRFKFTTDNQSIQRISLLIDRNEKGSVESDTGTFFVDCQALYSGVHDLTINIYTATGTGSLAEELGAEHFVGSRTWKLVFISGGYYPDVKFKAKDGLLHLYWTAYMASNFKEYIIYRNGQLFKTRNNEFVDSIYVGEGASYTLKTISTDEKVIDTRDVYLYPEPPTLMYASEYPDHYLVKWNKSKYYKAIDSVLIFSEPINNYNDRSLIKVVTNPDDTVYEVTAHGKFCAGYNFYLRLVPRAGNLRYEPEHYYLFEAQTQGYIGFSFLPYYSFYNIYRTGPDEFVYIQDQLIYRYSLSQRKSIENIRYANAECGSFYQYVMVSNSGKYLASQPMCEGYYIYSAPGNDLHSYVSHHIDSIVNLYLNIAISDNGILLYQNLNGGFYLYSLVASKNAGHYPVGDPNVWSNLKISSDASHFMIISDSLKMINKSGGMYTDLWKIEFDPDKIRYYEFNPLDPGQVILWNGSKLSTIRYDDRSVVHEIPLNDSQILDIDYASDEILSYVTGHLYVRNMDDGSLKYDLPVDFEPDNWSQQFLLINHAIISNIGLIYFIP
jgi:hypothetical protein